MWSGISLLSANLVFGLFTLLTLVAWQRVVIPHEETGGAK